MCGGRADGALAVVKALPLLLLAACAVKAPVQRDKGLEPARTTLEALAEVRPARRVALVVGVDRYGDPAFPDLRHAGHDAEAISEQLRSPQGGGFDEVHTLIDANRAEVVAGLQELARGLRRDDTVMLYFSGHGTRAALPDGSWRRYLLTSDATSRDFATSALELEAIQTWLGTLPAARRALVVDACFDGEGKSVVPPGSAPEELPEGSPRVGVGEAHLFATTAGRPSREDDKLEHGVYTWYLLDAMTWSFPDADADGDGVLTAWEAHDHARGRTIDHTEGVQVPQAAFQVVGEADVVLAGKPSARRARDRALVYLYPSGSHALAGAALTIDGRDKGLLPGTVPVAPGRHHVVVHDAEGQVVVDGTMRFAPGQSYRADEVARLAQGPSRMVGWRLATAASPPLDHAVGSGAIGPELWWAHRRNEGTATGLLSQVALGIGGAPARQVDGELQLTGRPVVWASGGSGFQGDIGRLRGRAALGLSTVWIPPSYGGARPEAPPTNPSDVRSEAGWLFVAAGPSLGLGWVLGRGWTLHGELRPHLGALDADGDGTVSAVPWVVGGIGLEADL